MMALEQVTLDDRWDLAYLLTHQTEPSSQMMGRQPERSSLRPFSRLAEPRWIAAAVAYLRDIDLMSERRRKRSEDGPNPKAPRKWADRGGGKGGDKGTYPRHVRRLGSGTPWAEGRLAAPARGRLRRGREGRLAAPRSRRRVQLGRAVQRGARRLRDLHDPLGVPQALM